MRLSMQICLILALSVIALADCAYALNPGTSSWEKSSLSPEAYQIPKTEAKPSQPRDSTVTKEELPNGNFMPGGIEMGNGQEPEIPTQPTVPVEITDDHDILPVHSNQMPDKKNVNPEIEIKSMEE